jgi:catechol 2,3-dioxygenase-like lactoylglutathione lyase family enzyme
MPVLSGIHHVKLPVDDVGRSRRWYETVLGLEAEIEFVEEGELRGVALRDPGGTLCVALRLEPERVAALAGFDPLTLQVDTHAELKGWLQHLDDLGEAHGGIVAGHEGWALVGLHDPDGIELRLYTLERVDGSAP